MREVTRAAIQMRLRSRVVAVVLLAAYTSAGVADWTAYSSQNFTLYSDAPEDEVLELLRDFEEYRRAALAVMNLRDEPENQELKIVYPSGAADFRALAGDSEAAGFFYHREFGPRIVLQRQRARRERGLLSGSRAEASANRRTLYHEYVHYLMDQRSGLNYPPWYREGLAQVLMMVDPSESTMRVGMPLGRIEWQSVGATVEDIIDTDYDGDVGEFYVMSWLLTHYLTIGAVDEPERARSTADYLRRYDAGEDPVEAFAASFGQTPAALQPRLQAYGRQSTIKVLYVPRWTYEGDVSRREMKDGEELYLLGDLAVELYESATALDLFERFDKRHGSSPLGIKVKSRRAVALAHEDRLDEGDALIEELLALDVDDADVLADISHYFHDRFQIRSQVSRDEANANLEQSIHYGELAVERDPEDLEALFYLGRAYGWNGNPEKGTDILLRAFNIAPGAETINASLARMLLQAGYVRDATLLLSRVYSASHSEAQRQRYRELLQQIREGNVDPAFLNPYSTDD